MESRLRMFIETHVFVNIIEKMQVLNNNSFHRINITVRNFEHSTLILNVTCILQIFCNFPTSLERMKIHSILKYVSMPVLLTVICNVISNNS